VSDKMVVVVSRTSRPFLAKVYAAASSDAELNQTGKNRQE